MLAALSFPQWVEIRPFPFRDFTVRTQRCRETLNESDIMNIWKRNTKNNGKKNKTYMLRDINKKNFDI